MIKVGDSVAFFFSCSYGVGAVTSIKNNRLTVKLSDGKVHWPYGDFVRAEEAVCHIKQAVKLKSIKKQDNGNILITAWVDGEFERKNPFKKGDIVACYEWGGFVFYGEVRYPLGSCPDSLRVNVIDSATEDMIPHWRQCEKLKGWLKWKIKAQIMLKAFRKAGEIALNALKTS